MSEMTLSLDCTVCGQEFTFTTEEPVQWQQAYDLWARDHKHTRAQLQAYYKSEREDAEA